MIMILNVLMAGLTTVFASHGFFRSCFECASEANKYMCSWNDTIPGEVACCEANSTSLYCQPSEMNLCSPALEEVGSMFYSYCPGIDYKKCGTDMKNLTLQATEEEQKFAIPALKHIN